MGKPRDPSSLVGRIEQHFRDHPNCIMPMEDMEQLFGADREQINHAMRNLRDFGRMQIRAIWAVRREDAPR